MDMSRSNLTSEFHVAQQSRRDKLRIQQDSNSPDNLAQIPAHHHDSLPYNYCPQMLVNLHHESDDKREICDAAAAATSFGNFYRPISDPHCFTTWKSIPDWDLSASQFRVDPSSDVVSMPSAAPSLCQNPLPEQLLVIPELGHRNYDESGDSADWISRAPELLTVGELNYYNTQALSLSLSSVPSLNVQTSQGSAKIPDRETVHSSRNWKPDHQLSGTLAMARRNPGPLGPFTGYATILRSSKFLRPAQLLLDDICCFTRQPNNAETREEVSDKTLSQVRVSDEVVSNGESAVWAIGHSCGGSLPFDDSSDKSLPPGRVDCLPDSLRPDHLQKKAKLLYLQDEAEEGSTIFSETQASHMSYDFSYGEIFLVLSSFSQPHSGGGANMMFAKNGKKFRKLPDLVCKRYKQYHQQMQMVVSSFESVAGLSAATPYVSSALKMVSKHFRCLKNAITDQLKGIRNALGEDLSFPGGVTSNANGGVLKLLDQSLQKQKRADGGLGCILESQHVWRPQRGLPERAVSILRAWLFDHFLHPYPTDTDKHMLASQTGLTRNQVSNWFINARVRLWKPMVEEIHMLETKGMTDKQLDTGKTTKEASNQATNAAIQSFNMHGASALLEKRPEYLNDNPWEGEASGCMSSASIPNQDKRSRIEYHVPSSIGGPLMEMVPRIDMGPSLSAVSLTLGLRQSAENAQRPLLPEHHHHHHMRPHFGGHIIG